jgi:hypothetical protein
MITIIYHTSIEEAPNELEWLRGQKIYPAHEEIYDWKSDSRVVRFGFITSPEQALAVKLRHKLDLQKNYKQR